MCIRVHAYVGECMRVHACAYADMCVHVGTYARVCAHVLAYVGGGEPPGASPPMACVLLKIHPLFKKILYFRPFFLGWPDSCNYSYSI
mgnify:CR=1 FL=1